MQSSVEAARERYLRQMQEEIESLLTKPYIPAYKSQIGISQSCACAFDKDNNSICVSGVDLKRSLDRNVLFNNQQQMHNIDEEGGVNIYRKQCRQLFIRRFFLILRRALSRMPTIPIAELSKFTKLATNASQQIAFSNINGSHPLSKGANRIDNRPVEDSTIGNLCLSCDRPMQSSSLQSSLSQIELHRQHDVSSHGLLKDATSENGLFKSPSGVKRGTWMSSKNMPATAFKSDDRLTPGLKPSALGDSQSVKRYLESSPASSRGVLSSNTLLRVVPLASAKETKSKIYSTDFTRLSQPSPRQEEIDSMGNNVHRPKENLDDTQDNSGIYMYSVYLIFSNYSK